MAKSRSLVNRGTVRAETARPPTSAHRAFTAFRSATELRSADSADAMVPFPGGQAQLPAARGLGRPCPHHAVDLIPVSMRMLTVHSLPVQPDTELVHVQSRLRSEEHTSELQSRFDLVCRLLLE